LDARQERVERAQEDERVLLAVRRVAVVVDEEPDDRLGKDEAHDRGERHRDDRDDDPAPKLGQMLDDRHTAAVLGGCHGAGYEVVSAAGGSGGAERSGGGGSSCRGASSAPSEPWPSSSRKASSMSSRMPCWNFRNSR